MQLAIGATLQYSRLFGKSREIRLRLKQNDSSWALTEAWRQASRISPAGDSDDVHCSIYDYYAALLTGRISSLDGERNTVLTFNYDLLPEESLARLGIRFSYGFGDAGAVHRPSAPCVPNSEPGVLTILKLHGSVNWRLDESDGRLYVLGTYDDVVEEGMKVPHEEIVAPHVVPPTWDKAVTTSTLHVWRSAVDALTQATRVIIVGFSFRTMDAHFKYLLAGRSDGKQCVAADRYHQSPGVDTRATN